MSLTHIKRIKSGKHPSSLYRCHCGVEKEIQEYHVKTGATTSCGCYRIEKISSHGLRQHPLYKIWLQMNFRCRNPKCKNYKDYGGRGVRVCDEWVNDFTTFYNWALSNGWQKGLCLDKDIKAKKLGIDALLYSPEFCSFVTPKENLRNTRWNKIDEAKAIAIRASDKRITELMKLYSVSRRTIQSIRHGESWV